MADTSLGLGTATGMTAVHLLVLLVAYRIVARFLSRRRQAERSLRDAQVFASSTVDALPTHIAILNEQGIVEHANRAWRDHKPAPQGGLAERTLEGKNYLAVCEEAGGKNDPN